MLNLIWAEDAPVLPVHDSFIVRHAYGELGELEEEMGMSFHGPFKKDINAKSEIGVILSISFYATFLMKIYCIYTASIIFLKKIRINYR